MRFSVSSGELLNRLQTVGKVIVAKNSIPVLDNFLFIVSGSELLIVASDAEVSLRTTLTIGNEGGDGRVAVPSGKILELLAKLPEQPITLNIIEESSVIDVVTATGNYSLIGQNADEYPEAKPLSTENTQELRINAEAFVAGLDKAAFAAGVDELRPIMNGVFVDIEENCITFVATDSHKLSRYTRSDVHAGFVSSFVLNRKPVTLLCTMLSRADGEITVAFDSESAVISSPSYRLQCRLVAGTYPAYRSVIPQGNDNHVMLNRDDLLSAISRVQIFSDSTKLIRFDISANSIEVMAQDLDFSYSATETVPCQYTGNDMSIGFKASLFIELLKNMSAPEIIIKLGDQSRASLIVPAVKSDIEDELMLVMPMKI